MIDLLKKTLAAIGYAPTDVQLSQFAKFYDMLIEWNEKFNLTRITTPEDACTKHFADSLSALKYIGGKVCDVGSGGGFPAIPLAIALPDAKFTLVESNGKKSGFLQAVIDELRLENCEVKNARAEDLKDCREKFDVVTARAVAELNTLSEYCMPLVRVGGTFVAYKGENADNEVNGAKNAVAVLGGAFETVEKFSLFGNSRALVVVKKVSSTPPKYPRGQGKPRSKPL